MYARTLDVREIAARKSLFLFGPRSTGKTTLLKAQFDARAVVNLLRSSEYLPLAESPSRLREIVAEGRADASIDPPVVVIDEIQKLPALLDEVHDLIETRGIHFVLSGSSGRKLKDSGVNLLGGRAWQANLFPLTSAEVPDFDLGRYLLHGGLPQVYDSEYPEEELDAYVNTYLREEIRGEALVRNFVHFARFLNVAALCSGQQLNFANVSRDTGVPATSVSSYFEILADTFIGFLVLPWRGSRRRKAVATAKFYFFDVGVANFLRGISVLNRNSSEYGIAFEHFIAMELRSYLSYRRPARAHLLAHAERRGGGLPRRLGGGDRGQGVRARLRPRPERPARPGRRGLHRGAFPGLLRQTGPPHRRRHPPPALARLPHLPLDRCIILRCRPQVGSHGLE